MEYDFTGQQKPITFIEFPDYRKELLKSIMMKLQSRQLVRENQITLNLHQSSEKTFVIQSYLT